MFNISQLDWRKEKEEQVKMAIHQSFWGNRIGELTLFLIFVEHHKEIPNLDSFDSRRAFVVFQYFGYGPPKLMGFEWEDMQGVKHFVPNVDSCARGGASDDK